MKDKTGKQRGSKYHGRGHKNFKSGSRGGTGRAGWRAHKLHDPRMIIKKNVNRDARTKYISTHKLLKNWTIYKAKGLISLEKEIDPYDHTQYNTVFISKKMKIDKVLNKSAVPYITFILQ